MDDKNNGDPSMLFEVRNIPTVSEATVRLTA